MQNNNVQEGVCTSRSKNLIGKEVFKRLLSVREAAAYLGTAPGTLYNWASARRIAAVKVGRALRFDIRVLDQLIEDHIQPALPPIQEAVECKRRPFPGQLRLRSGLRQQRSSLTRSNANDRQTQ